MRPVRRFAIAVATIMGFLMTPAAQARQDALKVGSAAPAVSSFGLEYLRGSDDAVANAKVVVFEFWATWCGPCKASIPHINDMYKAMKPRGLVVVGISDETKQKVEPFLNARGDAMSYFVALDKDKKAASDLLKATGGGGIPHAVVVADGKIVFIGNPHPQADGEKLEAIIKRCLGGRYDPELTPKGDQIVAAARRSAKERNWVEAYRFYDQVVDSNTKLFLDAALERYSVTLRDQKDPSAANAFAKATLEKYETANDAAAMREIALALATDPTLPSHDYDTALAAAKKYESMAKEDDYEVHSTLASVYAAKGEFPAAVAAQTSAWRMAPTECKPALKRDLEAYKQADKAAGRQAQTKLPSTGTKE